MRRIWNFLCRLFSRRVPEGPHMYDLLFSDAGRYKGMAIFVFHWCEGNTAYFAPHICLEEDCEGDHPGQAVLQSGRYDTPRAAYLAAKMQIDEMRGFGVPNPTPQHKGE